MSAGPAAARSFETDDWIAGQGSRSDAVKVAVGFSPRDRGEEGGVAERRLKLPPVQASLRGAFLMGTTTVG